jgi:hypothetical protein
MYPVSIITTHQELVHKKNHNHHHLQEEERRGKKMLSKKFGFKHNIQQLHN